MRYSSVIIILFLTAVSCHKGGSFESSGLITQRDYAYCMFCGGDFLKSNDTTYRFDGLPGMSHEQFDKLQLPQKIIFNWVYKKNDPNPGIWIIITSYTFY